MSDTILDALCEAFTGHGLACEHRDGAACIQDGLVILPRIAPGESANGAISVQLDLEIQSPRLNGTAMLDSFAGIGATREEAEKNAFGKFLLGSFHVLTEALTSHRCGDEEVEWEEWQGADHAWKVCSGPVLQVATHHGASVGGFQEFYDQLSERFTRSMPPGPHWVHVFIGGIDGERLAGEVIVDGSEWTEGRQLLEEHAWALPEGYASCRHLLIALPAEAGS
jgi:hypothetical protein